MIDVIHQTDALSQLQQVANRRVEVLRLKCAVIERSLIVLLVQLDVEFQTAHAREVVLAGVEEHSMEERGCRVERRRIAGPQFAVDLDQRFLRCLHGIAAECV